MNIIDRRLVRYCERHSSELGALLDQVEQKTGQHTLAPQMISGRTQGALLSFISRMKQPESILEIGTFTGYATLCLAEGLPDNGEIHTIEGKPLYDHIYKAAFEQSTYKSQIIAHTGMAEDVIPTLDKSWDLVFIDGGKKQYAAHYDLVIDHVNPGGIILADNVLWSGKVIAEDKDADTVALDQFNKMIAQDGRVKQVLLPLRDGLFIIEKL